MKVPIIFTALLCIWIVKVEIEMQETFADMESANMVLVEQVMFCI